MRFSPGKLLRWFASALSVVLLLGVLASGWFYWRLRTSLPQLDGRAWLPGTSAPVTVTRDSLGIPTVHGATRADVARALGYLHAQDRFFQMDTLRRRAAGELAEIVGRRALALDRSVRIHGFRALAQGIVSRLPLDERALIESYTAGVNAGLKALSARPFEYILLRVDPQPWRSEDSLLVAYSMCLELEDSTGTYERSLMAVRDQLGSAALAFFAASVMPGDAAIDGSTAPLAPMPTEAQLDLRKRRAEASAPLVNGFANLLPDVGATLRRDSRFRGNEHRGVKPLLQDEPASPEYRPGSNSIALTGARTANGAGLLGNDMHLELRLPNTWYRASLEWPDHKVTGATLPGIPLVIVGSNGRVAWGFTASYVDRTDLIVLQGKSGDPSVYLRNNQLVLFQSRREEIAIKGEAPVAFNVQMTDWGPVIGQDTKTRPLALHWLAHDPAAINLGLMALESVANVEEAAAAAHRAGTPSLNFLAVDSTGRAAWTIAGRLPERFGYDGRLPANWYFGDRGWKGLLPPDEVPTVFAASGDQLWTANNRIVGGRGLAVLGDSGYAQPLRAAQLRDDLSALKNAKPADFLSAQLDDRALYLERWQKLLLSALTPASIAEKKSRGELRSVIEKWEGRASVDSASYRLVRAWRSNVADRALNPIFAPCLEDYAGFSWRSFNFEVPLWKMLEEKPDHLLDPRYVTWENLLLAAADDVTSQLDDQHIPLSAATWGRRNTARIQHPLASAFPAWLTSWLAAPADPLPGDNNLPRVQTPSFGASERMSVSPGHEAEGIFHMPGGQSGHPLSPYFLAGHEAWVQGKPTPFLPGKTEHTLTLQP